MEFDWRHPDYKALASPACPICKGEGMILISSEGTAVPCECTAGGEESGGLSKIIWTPPEQTRQ